MTRPARTDPPQEHDDLAARLRADLDHATTNFERLQAEYEELLADPDVIQEDRDSTRLLLESARSTAQTAEEAIQRHTAGEYGVCSSCGAPIGAERLDAIPDATTCVGCPATRS